MFASPSNPTAQLTLMQAQTSAVPNPNVSIEVDDVDAGVGEAAGEGVVQLGPAEADVVANADGFRVELIRIGTPDSVGEVGVELGWHHAAHVVCLERWEELAHKVRFTCGAKTRVAGG